MSSHYAILDLKATDTTEFQPTWELYMKLNDEMILSRELFFISAS